MKGIKEAAPFMGGGIPLIEANRLGGEIAGFPHRLHCWGYGYYREMFNARQLLGLELSAKRITRIANVRVRCRKKRDNF